MTGDWWALLLREFTSCPVGAGAEAAEAAEVVEWAEPAGCFPCVRQVLTDLA